MQVDIENSIVIPKEEKGDFSSSISFALAKRAKNSPMKIADELAKALSKTIEKNGVVKKIISESGYINIWLGEAVYGKYVIDSVIKEGAGYSNSERGKGKSVILEYPSVNPNKPWHIGHLRNALLGDSISRIMKACSYKTEREDYIDDLGLQMAEILWGLKDAKVKGRKKYDQFLGEEYVRINKEIEEKKAEGEITSILKRMEEKESKESKEVRKIAERSVRAQYETAFSYGIYHDVMVWESDILSNELLKRAMELLAKKKISKMPKEGKYEGCTVIETNDADENGEKVKVFIRSNGVATYIAKDFAFHLWKFGLLGAGFKYSKFMEQPDGSALYSTSKEGEKLDFGGVGIVVNIIGSEQRYPQGVLREVLKSMGMAKEAESLVHIAYGEVGVKDGTLSGRTGGWLGEGRNLTADDLLKEMQKKTLEIVKNSEKIKEHANEEEIAKKVALSAIKFEFLRITPEKKVTFEWEKALDLSANSGPYCMYMYARASRILEKSGSQQGNLKLKEPDYERITRGPDFELIKLIGSAQERLEKACAEYRPDMLADYLIELSLRFSSFYEKMPVLKGEESKAIRIGIVLATRQVLYNMMSLLGIQTVEQM